MFSKAVVNCPIFWEFSVAADFAVIEWQFEVFSDCMVEINMKWYFGVIVLMDSCPKFDRQFNISVYAPGLNYLNQNVFYIFDS